MINREQQPLSHTVERTGLAVVHEGERIVAAADSAAVLRSATTVVNYYFPVEVEIVGADAADSFTEQLCDALQRDIASMG